ncbi:MAG: hypothetical protein P8Z75_11670 [Gammaproteobacteria bacterium]
MLSWILLQMSCLAQSAQPLPPAIKAFCDMAFSGKIARNGALFNSGGSIVKGVPSRRIVAYKLGAQNDYLWYEHGGKHYHQHLVKFSNTPPYEVKASYVFDSTRDKTIQQLIKDTRFLDTHLTNHCGL